MSSYSMPSPSWLAHEQSDDGELFEIANYLDFDQDYHEEHTLPLPVTHPAFQQGPLHLLQMNSVHVSRSGSGSCSNGKSVVQNSLNGRSTKVAFKTKSEHEIMDDGYKWRKYGKKMVKNSQNPRNYYRCLSQGCNVKKRVERAREDSSYVITAYEGVHNHQAPTPAATALQYVHDMSSFSHQFS